MEKPINFNSEMIQAILDGRKTQTRRIAKQIPSGDHYGKDIMDWPLSDVYKKDGEFYCEVQIAADDHACFKLKCPYGKVGDRFPILEDLDFEDLGRVLAYVEDGEITDIRVERLQEISENDAWQEGTKDCDVKGHDDCFYGTCGMRCGFEQYWDTIAKDGEKWADNKFVWVITFKRVK